jgi:2-phosphosulfolactate phosphatase
MTRTLEVLFTPADFSTLAGRNLSAATCVVLDVLRATTSMTTALANGAEAIIPVAEINEAIEIRRSRPDVLLAGERDGLRITKAQTGSIDFDLGNSPREFTAERVRGKTIVMTTTNGTRALRACAGANQVLIGSFLNPRDRSPDPAPASGEPVAGLQRHIRTGRAGRHPGRGGALRKALAGLRRRSRG